MAKPQSFRNFWTWLTRTILQSKNTHISSFPCSPLLFFFFFFSPLLKEVGKANTGISETGLWKESCLRYLLGREDWVELLLCLRACQHKTSHSLLLPWEQVHAEGFRLSFWPCQSPLIKLLKLCAPAGASWEIRQSSSQSASNLQGQWVPGSPGSHRGIPASS